MVYPGECNSILVVVYMENCGTLKMWWQWNPGSNVGWDCAIEAAAILVSRISVIAVLCSDRVC
jgi:hypothetical protein